MTTMSESFEKLLHQLMPSREERALFDMMEKEYMFNLKSPDGRPTDKLSTSADSVSRRGTEEGENQVRKSDEDLSESR